MKEKYEHPEIEVIILNKMDIICTSGGGNNEGEDDIDG